MAKEKLVTGCENPEQREKQRKSVLDNLDILKQKIFVDDKGRNYFIYHIYYSSYLRLVGLLVRYEDRQSAAKDLNNILADQEALDPPEEFIHELETFNGVEYLNPLNDNHKREREFLIY